MNGLTEKLRQEFGELWVAVRDWRRDLHIIVRDVKSQDDLPLIFNRPSSSLTVNHRLLVVWGQDSDPRDGILPNRPAADKAVLGVREVCLFDVGVEPLDSFSARLAVKTLQTIPLEHRVLRLIETVGDDVTIYRGKKEIIHYILHCLAATKYFPISIHLWGNRYRASIRGVSVPGRTAEEAMQKLIADCWSWHPDRWSLDLDDYFLYWEGRFDGFWPPSAYRLPISYLRAARAAEARQ
jgi:hypothetical protein